MSRAPITRNLRPYKVERAVPMPLRTDEILPLSEMQVGDSFAVPDKDGITANALNNALTRFRQMAEYKTWRFMVRTISAQKCRRVWRVQ